MLKTLRDETIRALLLTFLVGAGLSALFIWLAIGDGWVSRADVERERVAGESQGRFRGFRDAREVGGAAGLDTGIAAGIAQATGNDDPDQAQAAGYAQGWNEAIDLAIATAIPAGLDLIDALDEWRALRLNIPVIVPAPPPREELQP